MMAALPNLVPTSLLADSFNPLEHVVDHPLYHVGWFYLTNHMLLMIVSAALMLLIFPWITRDYRAGKLVPTGTRNMFEVLLVFFRETVVRPVLGDQTDKYIGYIWTLFFFILFNNLLGMLPLEAITTPLLGAPHAIGGAAMANIYVTGMLAAISFVVIQVSGVRANGLKKYLSHFLGGAPWYLAIIMVPIEILGIFTKPFALAIRLFANTIAGHIILAVMVWFVAAAFAALGKTYGAGIGAAIVLASTALMCLELFVAVLQSYIFAFLTTLFIGLLTAHHDEGHDETDGHSVVDHHLSDAQRQAATHMAG
jgi:F-type H+-transporting ATPase subunit a